MAARGSYRNPPRAERLRELTLQAIERGDDGQAAIYAARLAAQAKLEHRDASRRACKP
jgi:hypothetical protein